MKSVGKKQVQKSMQKYGGQNIFRIKLGFPAINRKTIKEWVKYAENLAIKHDGILPNPKWLLENGENSLYEAMLRNSIAFIEIPQKRLTNYRKILKTI